MILFLVKSGICLGLLLAFYHLVLEREKMHQFNRFYLLGSILFSFLAPSFIIYTEAAEIIEPLISTIQNTVAPMDTETPSADIAVSKESINYTTYLIGFHLLISGLLFIRFGKNLWNIIQKTRTNKKIAYKNATLVLIDENILPHTFLNYIFINANEYKTKALEDELFTHELTHVTQKHTIDVLLIELLYIVFWFNPLFILLKKAIQLNHEFLADDHVITAHKNISEYQYLLLNKTSQNNNIYLASNLNYSLTKKRLLMMTTPSSKSKILLKKLTIIPLLIGFTFLFANRVEAQEQLNEPKTQNTTKFQQKATPEMIAEYNAIIRKLNTEQNKIFKLKEVKRLEYIYNLMTETQKRDAEPFPKLPPPPPATKNSELIAEYNKLAKKYNTQPKNKRIIKLKEVKRLEYLYNLMTKEQKKNAEPFPKLPPPPPAPRVIKNIDLPPPPPIPANATKEQKANYQKTIDNYKKGNDGHVYKRKTKDGKTVDVVEIPDEDKLIPPPPSKSKLDHVIDTSKKGAKFFYNGKKVTPDEAIDLVNKNPKVKISSHTNNGKSTVRISTKRITKD